MLKTDGLGVQSTLGNIAIVLVFAMVLGIFGEMEVDQLKDRVRTDEAAGKNKTIVYWNLNHLIWNEWGLVSLSIQRKIQPLLSEEDIEKSIQSGDLILARDTDRGKEIEALAAAKFPGYVPHVYPWNRWKTHAQDGAGNSLVGKAWRERDLSILFDHALMMRFDPPQGVRGGLSHQ